MKKNIKAIKVESKSNNTIAGKLEGIIRQAFPMAINTGRANDVGTIKPEPKSRGKAVNFTWRKTLLKLTEALKVTEHDWKHEYTVTPLALEAQTVINNHLHPAVAQIIEDQQAEQEIKTEAAVS